MNILDERKDIPCSEKHLLWRTLFLCLACACALIWTSCSQSSQETSSAPGSDQSTATSGGGSAPPSEAAAVCGNGVIEAEEQCDDGNRIDDDGCTNSCTLPRCGDGIVQAGEQCDDGNQIDNDGCTNHCTLPVCGDGIVQAGEQCDDGNDVDNDGCTNSCTLPVCGDGIVQVGEACDDGNRIDNDGCTNDCALPTCGDGIVQAGEQCDDGNQSNTDGCTNRCMLPACGDGFLQAGEQCDDGNTASVDGCSATCKIERYPYAFVSRRANVENIFFSYVEPAGTPAKQLTSNPNDTNVLQYPNLAFKPPAGDRILYPICYFYDPVTTLPLYCELKQWVFDPSRGAPLVSEETVITDFDPQINYNPVAPAFSPDGAAIAYIAHRPTYAAWHYAIVRDDNPFDAVEPWQVDTVSTADNPQDRFHDLAWAPTTNASSPFYNKLFYSWRIFGDAYSLYWHDARSVNSNLIRDETNASVSGRAPVPNPDMSRLVYECAKPTLAGRLCICALQASSPSVVTCTQEVAITSGGVDKTPSWSADGLRIIFSSYRSGHYGVYWSYSDGSHVTPLIVDANENIRPVFFTRIQ